MDDIKYNHDRPLSSFKEDIKTIESEGFKVIAVTQMYFEDTFVFKTPEEVNKAYEIFEKNNPKICAWWYGKDDFIKAVKEYETESKGYSKVKTYWL